MGVDIIGLSKVFEVRGQLRESAKEVRAVDDLHLSINDGEFFTLLGPSGCGKTTTLRCVAGLETPTNGEIRVNDRILFSGDRGLSVPANERRLGMVFQSYAIWPHLSIFDNVAYPLVVQRRKERPARRVIKQRVAEVLDVVQLSGMERRSSTSLSGGQQQRVALARALILEPPVLLLDEPLSNLDAKLREDMRFELKRVQQQLGVTTIYVTHDQAEALSVSSRIAVMNNGVVEQVGTPREIYREPATRFVGDFVGISNMLTGKVQRFAANDRQVIQCGELEVLTSAFPGLDSGADVWVSLRPEDLTLWRIEDAPEHSGDVENMFSGIVLDAAFLGTHVEYRVEMEGGAILKVDSKDRVPMEAGTGVAVGFASNAAILVP